MPRAAGKQCHNPSCPNLQPCSVHGERKPVERIKPAYYKWYYRKSWKTMRLNQLRKAPYCEDCLERGIREPANEVDHIVRHEGDSKLFYSKENLKSLCKPCHSRKTAKEVGFYD